MDLVIGGVAVAALVVGIVEMAKEFGVEGKASRVVAAVVAFALSAVALVWQQGLIPEQAVMWVEIVFKALAGMLAAMGYYDLSKKFWTQ